MSFGYDASDVHGDVMGDYAEGDVMGEVVGARGRFSRNMVRLPRKPMWRRQLAPGVPAPGTGYEPLPLTSNVTPASFTATVFQQTFTARPQRPFHAVRLLATVRRFDAGGSVGGLIVQCDGIFIGTRLQQVERGSFDLEVYAATAFQVELNLEPAQPGVLIELPLSLLGGVPAGADTINVSIQFLGHSVR